MFEPHRLAQDARDMFADPNQEIFLSAASAWEIAIKYASGKLRLPEPPASYVPRRMADQGIRPLAISHQHVLMVAAMARHHNDPFDRLLVAQANSENMVLMTADRLLDRYSLEFL